MISQIRIWECFHMRHVNITMLLVIFMSKSIRNWKAELIAVGGQIRLRQQK